MNERQKKFAEYYAQSGNVYQSAVQAGYSEAYAKTTACKMLENASVSEYIRSLAEKMQDERILSAKERQAMLSDIARDENRVEPSDRIRAIDTLNKMTGEYISKVEVSGLNAEMSKLDSLVQQMHGNV